MSGPQRRQARQIDPRQIGMPLKWSHGQEITVDLFAGGGGASLGIEMAIGCPVDIAVNHDPEAIAMHMANHPRTEHFQSDVFEVDPLEVTRGRPVGLLWASPDCKHFSKAKGGQPVEKKIRSLAWVVLKWAGKVRPRMIALENVEEFATWGPLVAARDKSGRVLYDAKGRMRMRPCTRRRGMTFRAWVRHLESLGYVVEWRERRACDAGAPTIRKRLYVIARRDGEPIIWPAPSHGDPDSEAVKAGELLPWRTAAECIDWSIPCPSIFLTKEQARKIGCQRPLVEATMARIAAGIWRYVITDADPFIVPITHGGSLTRTHSIRTPARTITTANRGELALAAPCFVPRHGEAPGQQPRARRTDRPAPAVTPTGNGASLAMAYMQQDNTGVIGHSARKPVSTITGRGTQQRAVTAFLERHFGASVGQRADGPAPTSTAVEKTGLVTSHIVNFRGSDRGYGGQMRKPFRSLTAQGNHIGEVRAFLSKYYGVGGQHQDARDPMHTLTAKARMGIVTVAGEDWQIVDIGLRMLEPREQYRAQGFPDSYIIDRGADGTPICKTSQTRMCGNSVSPVEACALVAANYRPRAIATPADTQPELERA